MRTTGLNGSPKYLMVWLPGWYWANFVVVSAVYVAVSYRVFLLTAQLRDFVIPKEGGAALAQRSLLICLLLGALYLLASLVAPAPPVPALSTALATP